jgi:hypothetical protein
MQEVKSENDWVKIKIEELLIKRLMRRQSELAAVFNAENNPFYVNGYMLARLTDSNLDMVINELKNEPSICYKGVSELPLPSNIISPVSYPLAFEVLSKFILNHELDKIKVSELVQQTKDAEDEKKKIVKAKQEEVTLDWIEKRIVQSMMIITREGINPSNLYWDEEKDMKLCMNAIKSHSELKNKKICPVCGVPRSTETCLEHEDTTAKEASFVDLVAQFYLFSLQKIYQLGQSKKTADFQKLREEVKEITCDTLKLRLKREPSEDDYNQTIEGERLQVAKAIAEIIGNILDKALNRKFKEKMNEKKSSR